MSIEIKVSHLPESVADATVLTWHKQIGENVVRDELLVELETDKVVLEVPAPADGVLEEILADTGEIVVGDQALGRLKEGAVAATTQVTPVTNQLPEKQSENVAQDDKAVKSGVKTSPAVRKLLDENNLSVNDVMETGKGGRILKEDVLTAISGKQQKDESARVKSESVTSTLTAEISGVHRLEQRVPMTRLRARIAERLLEAKQTTAMLTTFNEVNMQALMEMRTQYKELFEKTHNTRLGFMSLFVKAATIALQRFPEVNASIDNTDIIYHGYCDIGIAVSSDRGLVVPMLRNTEHMSMAKIEAAISDYATKAREGKLGIEDLQGGTFTITNGGIFGSLLSTPILNPPQSAILGMHAIQKRPVVVNDEIVIRPMMNLALSYDHRIIDGQGAVSFLLTIKQLIEDPARILLEV